LKKEAEEKIIKAALERDEVQKMLEDERSKGGDFGIRLTKLNTQKADTEAQLAVSILTLAFYRLFFRFNVSSRMKN